MTLWSIPAALVILAMTRVPAMGAAERVKLGPAPPGARNPRLVHAVRVAWIWLTECAFIAIGCSYLYLVAEHEGWIRKAVE